MIAPKRPRTRKKPADRYHHGDLGRALLDEAVRTIQLLGIEELTLRTVGDRLGVSRSALYRHFTDKQALLAAVGREGFRMLKMETAAAWEENGQGPVGFEAMGSAYVQFALAHPAHYRVMFGNFVESSAKDAAFMEEAKGAFQVLVDALTAMQKAALIRADHPERMAEFVWAVVHGTAMLAIDGQLGDDELEIAKLRTYAIAGIRRAIAAGTGTD